MQALLALYRSITAQLVAAGDAAWIDAVPSSTESAQPSELVEILRYLAAQHLLLRLGDSDGAATLLEILQRDYGLPESDRQRFHRLLSRFVADEFAQIRAIDPVQPPGSVLGLGFWGDDFIQVADRLCLGSLLADGNIPYLAQRDPHFAIFIHTAARDYEQVMQVVRNNNLQDHVVLRSIPDEVIDRCTDRYWLIGAIQSIHLAYAAKTKAAYYTIIADGIYSRCYLKELCEIIERDFDVVLLSGWRALRQPTIRGLEAFRRDRVYSISGRDLVELAMANLDLRHAGFVDPDGPGIPRRRRQHVWCGDWIDVHAPGGNVAVLRTAALHNYRPRFFSPLEGELDRLLNPSVRCYWRAPTDDFFTVDLSEEQLADVPRIPEVATAEFAEWWSAMSGKLQVSLFRAPQRIAVLRGPPGARRVPPVKSEQFMRRLADDIAERMEARQTVQERTAAEQAPTRPSW